jgi:hypothetical protein
MYVYIPFIFNVNEFKKHRDVQNVYRNITGIIHTGKGKVALFLIKYYGMKTYGEVEV